MENKTMFKYYEPNKNGKDYVVSDIHGCYSDLESKLQEVEFSKEKDRLFSVGDLTDRGPESERAMEFLKKDWFIPVIGNHEDIILKCYDEKTAHEGWHWQNGGRWFGKMPFEWRKEYISLIKKLPLVVQVGNFGIIHSRMPIKLHWGDLTANPEGYRDYVLWERNNNLDQWTEGISGIFAGHTIHENPVAYGNTIDIDTGAFLKYWEGENGRLTIVEICHG